jgi:hypothetical protein
MVKIRSVAWEWGGGVTRQPRAADFRRRESGKKNEYFKFKNFLFLFSMNFKVLRPIRRKFNKL